MIKADSLKKIRDPTPIMENQMETTIIYRGFIGIMEKTMENEMETLGSLKGVYRGITPIMDNQMEKRMDN